jgi:hypothetical protein
MITHLSPSNLKQEINNTVFWYTSFTHLEDYRSVLAQACIHAPHLQVTSIQKIQYTLRWIIKTLMHTH